MRAITQKSFGGPEVLELTEAPRPVPGPTEVLVRVQAVGINPVEAVIRAGAFALIGQPPFTLGWDVSGVVAEVDPGVNRFQVGDEVYGMPYFPRAADGYAEYVAAPSRQLVRKPAGLSHVEAAALPLAGLTAWQMLVDIAAVGEGQRVLIHGAGGGVGHLAVQIAKARGAYVIATASAAKHPFLRELGADETVDYRATDFAAVVRDVDAVIETVGGDTGRRSVATLRHGGILVTAVDKADAELARAAETAGVRFAGISVEPDVVGLESLNALVETGQLRPYVEQTFDLADAAKAHGVIEGGHVRGKVVLTV
ncbi:NADPH:quinone reductase-like Zn-dependent oxidoreductase [Streptomyces sp. 846.5]|nr:NADP-dependent oxidoreductase [Streptomyces sp. 846.5]TDU04729.1 NADPH:quinone reductase-like Zn-dependent oxidoreductase [Streptomyces sp. 846.5]